MAVVDNTTRGAHPGNGEPGGNRHGSSGRYSQAAGQATPVSDAASSPCRPGGHRPRARAAAALHCRQDWSESRGCNDRWATNLDAKAEYRCRADGGTWPRIAHRPDQGHQKAYRWLSGIPACRAGSRNCLVAHFESQAGPQRQPGRIPGGISHP
ncbi:hypothetical protein D3C76_467380 [compost metagenome]